MSDPVTCCHYVGKARGASVPPQICIIFKERLMGCLYIFQKRNLPFDKISRKAYNNNN